MMDKISFEDMEPGCYYVAPCGKVVLCVIENIVGSSLCVDSGELEFTSNENKAIIVDGVVPGSRVYEEPLKGNVYTELDD